MLFAATKIFFVAVTLNVGRGKFDGGIIHDVELFGRTGWKFMRNDGKLFDQPIAYRSANRCNCERAHRFYELSVLAMGVIFDFFSRIRRIRA